MEQLYQVLRQLGPHIHQPNPGNAKWVSFMQKGIQLAKKVQNSPDIPQDVKLIVQKLLYEISAMPQVSGVKTTIYGNKWDELAPLRPPFWYRR